MGRKIRDAKSDPPGLVRDQRNGVFYARRAYSPGPGLGPKDFTMALGTTQKAEALRRFDHAIGVLRTKIESLRRDQDGVTRAGPNTETEQDKGRWWRDTRANATTTEARDNVEAAFEATLAKVLGKPIGEEEDERGNLRETYAPGREAKAMALVGLATGQRIPVDFYIDAFIASRKRSVRIPT
jgi:hypothetical protein